MQHFAALFESLDTTTSTAAKVEAMSDYFRMAPPQDAAWAVYVLMGRRAKRSVGPALLRGWLIEESNLPAWLVEETYGSVGDLAETIALLVPPTHDGDGDVGDGGRGDVSLTEWLVERILPLAALDVDEKRRRIVGWWRSLPYRECFLVNKLLTGALRVGVSRSLVARALSDALEHPRMQIERSLMGEWRPSADFWEALNRDEDPQHAAHPYPFFLAVPLAAPPQSLGERADWAAEWKWDGIRGQIVRRGGIAQVWSRGEEIITDAFPEIAAAAAALPDGTVLDGEVLAWAEGRPLPFARLQQRITRKKLTAALLAQIPAGFMAYDLLEVEGVDWRIRPFEQRRLRLEALLGDVDSEGATLRVSPLLSEPTWEALAVARDEARLRGVEGVMLKERQSAYGAGRQRGAWWKWKVDPFVFDGVLLYAMPGHGRRSNLYTDYTFGVWRGDALVPVAKAYSGLTDAEIQELDRWIRGHTREKFGTVRSVEPVQVFELAYEGIARSSRHKSGVALRFPRIVRWRTDKTAHEADRLEDLEKVLAGGMVER